MEATETAQTQTDATAAPAEVVNLLGETATTETTQPATETVKEPAKEPEVVKVEGAPEKYEFKAPEGQVYDSAILTAFETAAKDSNLTQDAAQKLLDKMSPAIAERQIEQAVAIRKGWKDASLTDKEFGGDNLQANLGIANKAYDAYATPELRKLMDSTGVGNHPEVIRMFIKIGKAISEDTFVGGKAAPPSSKSAAEILYDKS